MTAGRRLSAHACPACQRRDLRPLARTPQYGRCRCGMVARLSEREFAYDRAYFAEEDTDRGHRDFESLVARRYDEARFLPELAMVERMTPGRRLLDVGGATGAFARLAARRGWDPTVMEPSDAARDVAAGKGITAVPTLGEACALGPFDIVTLHHVLEHVDDPVAFLAELVPLVQPGGCVVIEVPNWRSTERRAAGAAWVDLRPEQHRWHFSPAPLRRTCERAGLAVLDVTTLCEALPTTESTLLAAGVPAAAVAAVRRARGAGAPATGEPEPAAGVTAGLRPLVAKAAQVEAAVLPRLGLGKRLRVVARPVAQEVAVRRRATSTR